MADTPARFPRTAQVPSATTFGSELASPTIAGTEANRVPAVPAAPVPPVPAVNLSPVLASAAIPALPSNESSPSRAAILVRIAVFLLVAGGGLYSYHRFFSGTQQNAPTQNTGGVPGGEQPGGTQPTSSQVSPSSAGASGEHASQRSFWNIATRSDSLPARGDSRRLHASLNAEEKAARARKVSATTSLGDLYIENGEYDNAIKEYQLGLDADPSNKLLLERSIAHGRRKKPRNPLSPD